MIAYFVSSATGWIAVILTAFEIVLPLFATASFTWPSSGRMSSFKLRGKNVAALLAGVLAGTAFSGACIRSDGGPLVRANADGIRAATGALSLLFLQVLLVAYLQSSGGKSRRLVKRCHFWGMLTFAGLLILHIGLSTL
jgi:hypothetical protein